jgi:retron-type reverse transcriptase
MEEVCELENCKQALQRVKANKGSPGVDGMTVNELPEHLKQHGLEIGEQLRNGTYKPKPVKPVEIPKPDGQGVRKLGIPCVLDRFVQQAVLQVLQKRWDPTFSAHSHGFRPGRSAKQAVHEAQQYIAEGYRWVVDLDLEKFFDRVNHDRLMAAVARHVADKRMLKLIRAFLEAGVMEDGLVSPMDEGTPQGGPLTPRTQSITSIWSGESSLSGETGTVNDTRSTLDCCLLQLYLYGICVPTPLNGRNASICREASCSVAGHWQMQFNSSPRYVPSHLARHIAT